MVNTMRTGALALVCDPEKGLLACLRLVSMSVVLNASGNSGTMLSHLFQELSKNVRQDFAESCRSRWLHYSHFSTHRWQKTSSGKMRCR